MSDSTSGPLVWDLPEPAGRAPRPTISRDRIARAALAVADTDGVSAVTMRRIATDLGSATPMSLYRYVGGKGGVLDLMLDAVFAEIDLPPEPGGDWRADLSTMAQRARRALRRHPWFAALSHHRPLLGPHALRHNEWSLRALDGHGLSIGTMMSVAGMVFGHAVSYAQDEAEESRMRAAVGVRTDAELSELARDSVQRVVADGRYPLLARWIEESSEVDPDEQFRLGLDCLLDGIAARIMPAG